MYLDAPNINAELRRFNLDWGGQVEAFLQLYLGEGMHSMFQPNTQIFFEQHALFLSQLLKTTASAEKLFYIPAQRVMALRDGLTRPFMDYRIGDPFVIRDFSEKLHGLVQTDFAQKEQLFPQSNRLTSELRDLINQAFFRNFS